jgi:hypothetical protein
VLYSWSGRVAKFSSWSLGNSHKRSFIYASRMSAFGVKRTSFPQRRMPTYDPKRTCVHGLASDAGATELNLTTSSVLFPQA